PTTVAVAEYRTIVRVGCCAGSGSRTAGYAGGHDYRHVDTADRRRRDPEIRGHRPRLGHRPTDGRRDPDARRDPRADPVAALHVRLVGPGACPHRSVRRADAEPAAALGLLS